MNKAAKKFMTCLKEANAIVIDNGPVLTSYDLHKTGDIESFHPKDVVVEFGWCDDEGLEYGAKFTRENIEKPLFKENICTLKDWDNERTVIQFFKLSPIIS